MGNKTGKLRIRDVDYGSKVGSSLENGSENQENFHSRLKGQREKHKITQSELAGKVGVSITTIQSWESDTIPKGGYLILLSKALNCTIDWLLTGEDKMLLDTATSPEPAALETEVLAQVVEGVEEFLRDEKKELEPDIKARLISLLYEHFSKAKEEPNQKTIENYLKLVA